MRKLWEHWKRIAKAIGNFNARVIMTVFYFLFLAPLSIPVKAKDPLAIRGKNKTGWIPRPASEGTPMDHAMRQF
jgi:hypothetical protein